MVQEFLMLEEITKNSLSLTQEKEENASVEIHNLTCYWDKVKFAHSTRKKHSSIQMNFIMLLWNTTHLIGTLSLVETKG